MADELDIGNEIFKGTQDVFSTMISVELERETFNGQNTIQSNLTSMMRLAV